ncbi:hypothetical protein DM860_017702 [Cuscuta australis]|uniref:Uncharacterized protein n=1 Tax=Cuscuta australis TaxID=267555 RepID=A0A328DB30_9ASTE|nr:hypothetical protein DM860_017702 [Cuscuta australis]
MSNKTIQESKPLGLEPVNEQKDEIFRGNRRSPDLKIEKEIKGNPLLRKRRTVQSRNGQEEMKILVIIAEDKQETDAWIFVHLQVKRQKLKRDFGVLWIRWGPFPPLSGA